ncbi:ImmA/IrrE family metallo-endopeptidase [Candidatus Roizmanbacteria bacterium]|nr:ImmA/IrrE family metallo-endopeptidase [Candidatus Roizmanbacteria bacterium]
MENHHYYKYEQIEKISKSVIYYYRNLRNDITLPIDVEFIIEHILNLKLLWNPIKGSDGEVILAMVTPTKTQIQMNSDQMQMFDSVPNLERTVLSHEIGHFILHKLEITNPGHSYKRSIAKSNDPLEREAHQFAACLLLPRDYLLDFIRLNSKKIDFNGWGTIYFLAQSFGVTKTMLMLRLKEIGILSRTITGEFISQTGHNYGQLLV